MTYLELVHAVKDKLGCTIDEGKEIIKTVVETIKEGTVETGETVVKDLGKFVINDRKARAGVNPKTGERIEIPASKVLKFKVSSGFKEAVKATKK